MRQRNTILGSLIALGLSSNLWALPQDPSPVHGQVQIQNGANFVQILQQTPQAIINWGQFNIGLGETVRFMQPNQQAAILNRVTGMDPSVIQGMLQANGRVFLLNPNGILFGPNAVVDVGSFTASTLKMSNEDFLNGTYRLTQDGSLPLAALTNQGTIRVAEGGFVVLVSPLLDNQGVILAQSGHVNLGATTQATFSVDGRGLVQFAVPDGFDPHFQGGGQGGTVLLQPGQMSQLLSQVVNNPALVEAGSFQSGANGQVLAHGAEGVLLNSGTVNTDGGSGNGGTIRLDSSQATILPASGVLSANSQSGSGGDVRLLSAGRTVGLGTITAAANGTGQGGFAEVSGKDLWLLGTVNVGSAQGVGGTILLDPTDITIIDGAGGTFDGQLPNPNGAGAGSVSVTAMQGQSSVQLNASHDVTYNGNGFDLGATSLSVVAGNDILFTTGGSIRASTLTLNATRDVIIAGTNSYALQSQSGDLSITGGRNVGLSSAGFLQLLSPTRASLTATGGDLTITTPQGNTFFIDTPRTDLVAGRNLTFNGSDTRHSVTSGGVFLTGQNITLQSSGGLNFAVGSVNATAGQDFVVNASSGAATLRSVAGPLNVTAGQQLRVSGTGSTAQSDNDRVILTGASVDVLAPSGGILVQSAQGVNVSSTTGDVNIRATAGQVYVRGGAGTVNITSPNDANLAAGSGFLDLESSGGSRVQATRDVFLSASQGNAIFLDSPRTDLVAGRNLTLDASDIRHSITSGGAFLTGQNITLQSSAGLNFAVGSVNATAGQDFVVNASNGAATLRSVAGPLNVTAGQQLRVSGTGSTVQSDTDRVILTGASVDVLAPSGGILVQSAQGVNVSSTTGDVNIRATAGQVYVRGGAGTVNITSPNDVNLAAGSGFLDLESNGGSRVQATRDIFLSASQGNAIFPDSPRTDLVAGRNLTLDASEMRHSITSGGVFLTGQNITLQSSGGLNFAVGSVNATAGQDFVVNASNGAATLRSVAGPLNVTAGQQLRVSGTGSTVQSDTDRVILTGASVDVLAPSGGILVQSAQGVNVSSTTGDVNIRATAGQVYVRGGAGTVNITSPNDVNLAAGSGFLDLESSGGSRVQATRDVFLSASQGNAIFPDSPRTDLIAGRNLTLDASDIRNSVTSGGLFLSGQNVTVQSSAGLNFAVGSVNATATQDFVVNASNGAATLRSVAGPLNVTAGQQLRVSGTGSTVQSDNDRVILTGASVDVLAPSGGILVQSVQGVNVTSTTGDVNMRATAGQVYVRGGAGTVNITSAKDVNLAAGSGYLDLESSGGSRVQATRDVFLSASQGNTIFPDSPRTDLIAGRNLTLDASDIRNSVTTGGLFLNGQNVTLQSSAGLSLNLGSLNVTASQDFLGNAAGGQFHLLANSGPLSVNAGENVSVIASGSASMQANTGGLAITGGNVALANVGLTAANSGPLNLTSTGNLTVGALATSSTGNGYLTGANITVNSMQNISGGNYTITTPGNLTEVTPATNPPQLAALNITAGRIFNLNAPDLGFSIPQVASAANLTALVTGGNETTVNPVQAASFHNFGTSDVQPGHIDFQTGDIYVDGVQVYGGLKPPDPPSPPPSPPPTPNPPAPPPVETPVTPAQAVQQQNALTPEQRSQILVQSNLAMGNLGSFSRVLSETEQEYLTARQDSMHQTWPLEPFSPTLALALPGGPPRVYPAELAQLQALLLMSSPGDDPEEKNRQANNVIVDQELREIWEVRYWRHLLEGFVIWEDRE